MSDGPKTRSSSSTSLETKTTRGDISNDTLVAIKSELTNYFQSLEFRTMISSILKETLRETVQITLDEHALKLDEMANKMVAIDDKYSELSKDLNILSVKLSVLVERVELHVLNLTNSVKELEDKFKQVKAKSNDNEQYSRRSNIRLFGIEETPDERCKEKVVEFFNSKLNLEVNLYDIDRCHRVGPKINDVTKSRAIIVKLVSYNLKSRVIKSRRSLKGSGYLVTEDLTKDNFNLLKEVKQSSRVEAAWSSDGKIFAKFDDGSIKLIRKISDILGSGS